LRYFLAAASRSCVALVLLPFTASVALDASCCQFGGGSRSP
jgi:hypothetical protein